MSEVYHRNRARDGPQRTGEGGRSILTFRPKPGRPAPTDRTPGMTTPENPPAPQPSPDQPQYGQPPPPPPPPPQSYPGPQQQYGQPPPPYGYGQMPGPPAYAQYAQ